MGRGIELHLLAGREVVAAGTLLGRYADLVTAAEVGERRVGDRDPAGGELLVDPHAVGFAAQEELAHDIEVFVQDRGPRELG